MPTRKKAGLAMALALAGVLSIGAAWLGRGHWDERIEAALFRGLKEQYPSLTRIEPRLLRDGPTITGTAVPKYYFWVRLFSQGTAFDAVAVRAALDGDRLDVLQVVPREEIRRDPAVLRAIFPADLIPEIERSAGTDEK